MVHVRQARATQYADALSLAEIEEGKWYKFHYCFPMGRRTDTSYEETWVRALVVKAKNDGVTLQHDGITHSFKLHELGMEPDKDGKYACHHRLARL